MFTKPGMTFGLMLILMALSTCSDTRFASYATFVDLSKQPQSARTWIPEVVDSTCYAIEVVYDIDTNDILGTFRLNDAAGFVNQLSRNLEPLPLALFQKAAYSSKNPSPPSGFQKKPAQAVFFKSGAFLLAVDTLQKRVYFTSITEE